MATFHDTDDAKGTMRWVVERLRAKLGAPIGKRGDGQAVHSESRRFMAQNLPDDLFTDEDAEALMAAQRESDPAA